MLNNNKDYELKPREKFLLKGGDQLTAVELLAIILETGSKDNSVHVLSTNLLYKYGGLKGIISQSIDELKSNKGIGEVKAIRLRAIYNIINIITEERYFKNDYFIKNSKDIYKYMKHYEYLEEENMFVICLNFKNKVINCKLLFKGTISGVTIHPREIFKYVLEHNASKICLVHNHPSGDPTPSLADLKVTKELIKVSKEIGIELIDHIIISSNKYCSLRDKYDIIF